MDLKSHFASFRKDIIGDDLYFQTPFGSKKMLYADWIASGRLYRPIEKAISERFGPFVGNTHTETSETGTRMTRAYHHAQKIIKQHCNAGPDDVIILAGFGMTAVVNKLQRILGLRQCGWISGHDCMQERERPVIFLTHMEHHSNHTSWFETIADVVMLPPTTDLLIDLEAMRRTVEQYSERKLKIGAFTACSNVTGIETPYHQMARIMHENGGLCFVDFAASAPYVDINMHPADPIEKLDAIYFSPHKFLGGPGSSGVLIFDSKLYNRKSPDDPGGGTVDWTNAWGEYKYSDDIEVREDGGTPGFLQAIRIALSIELKNKLNTSMMREREHELVAYTFQRLCPIPGLHLLADNMKERLGAISFYIDGLHYNLLVRLLNDHYGIQVRGGCACAGTYGHFLLDVTYERSHRITEKINHGDLSEKPGWVRVSLHPTMSDEEATFLCDAIEYIAANHKEMGMAYTYSAKTNEFIHSSDESHHADVAAWFAI